MPDSRGTGEWKDLWALLPGLVTLVGIFCVVDPLTSPRPALRSSHDRSVVITGQGQDTPARLWQDPFEALALGNVPIEEPDDSAGTEHSRQNRFDQFTTRVVNLREQFENRLKFVSKPEGPAQATDQLILMIMLQDGPEPELVERRIRRRQALVTALAHSGYVPDEPERLGWFSLRECLNTTEHDLSRKSDFGNACRFRVAWEIFNVTRLRPGNHASQDDDWTRRRPLPVVWVPESAFGKSPLSVITTLSKRLACRTSSTRCLVIGPDNPNTLSDMVLEASEHARTAKKPYSQASTPRCPGGTSGFTLAVLSPYVTASAGSLLGQADPEPRNRGFTSMKEELEKRFDCWELPIELVRPIATDTEQFTFLSAELCQRDTVLKTGKGDVALISEWDTFQGRIQPLVFTQCFQALTTHLAASAPAAPGPSPDDEVYLALTKGRNRTNQGKNIHYFSYMRGLDGVLPSRPGTSSSSGRPAQDQTRQSPTYAPPERPEGANQYDHLRRLARAIRERHEESRRQGRAGIRAVGVLGSDPYDKVLVLQAFRETLPDAIYFTTELDALYLSPQEFPHTRNLLVASPAGLGLTSQMQQRFAPFRSSQETALVEGLQEVLAAGPDKSCRASRGQAIQAETSPPRTLLFEVGRNAAVSLTSPLHAAWLPGPSAGHGLKNAAVSSLDGKHWGFILLLLLVVSMLLPWIGPPEIDSGLHWRYLHKSFRHLLRLALSILRNRAVIVAVIVAVLVAWKFGLISATIIIGLVSSASFGRYFTTYSACKTATREISGHWFRILCVCHPTAYSITLRRADNTFRSYVKVLHNTVAKYGKWSDAIFGTTAVLGIVFLIAYYLLASSGSLSGLPLSCAAAFLGAYALVSIGTYSEQRLDLPYNVLARELCKPPEARSTERRLGLILPILSCIAAVLPSGTGASQSSTFLACLLMVAAGATLAFYLSGARRFGTRLSYADSHYLDRRLYRKNHKAFSRCGPRPVLRGALQCGSLLLNLVIVTVVVLASADISRCDSETGAVAGEPFSWTSGTSAWPFIFCSLLLICAGWRQLLWGLDQLRHTAISIRDSYFPPGLAHHHARSPRDASVFLTILSWPRHRFRRTKASTDSPAIGQKDWAYKYHIVFDPARLLVSGAVLCCGALALIMLPRIVHGFSTAPHPFRSEVAQLCCFLTVLPLLFLILLTSAIVVLPVVAIWHWVELLSSRKSHWSPCKALQLLAKSGVPRKARPEMMDIEFIADISERILPLLRVPALGVAGALLARNAYWDHWSLSPYAMVVLGVLLAIPILCAVVLWNAASRARERALERLKLLRPSGGLPDAKTSGQWQAAIERIEQEQRGAFAPLLQQSFLRSLLYPIYAIGVTNLAGVFALTLNR